MKLHCRICDKRVLPKVIGKQKMVCPGCFTAFFGEEETDDASRSMASSQPVPFVATYFAQFLLGFYLMFLSGAVPAAVLLIEPMHQKRELLIAVYGFLAPVVCVFVCIIGLLPFTYGLVGRILYYKVTSFFPRDQTQYSETYQTYTFGKKAKLKDAVMNTLYWYRAWMLLGCIIGGFLGAAVVSDKNPNAGLIIVTAAIGAIIIRFAITFIMSDFISEIAPEEAKDYRRVLSSGVDGEKVRNAAAIFEGGWIAWLIWS